MIPASRLGKASSSVLQRSSSFIVYPDDSKMQRALKNERESTLVPTTIASLGNPVISALYAAAQRQGNDRMMRLDVDGRAYLSRVAPVMQQFGETDYLGMVVPVDEITGPIDRIRSDALVYSLVVLLLVLPLYVTLVFIWLDHRLGRRSLSLSDIRGIDTADLE